MNLENLLEKTKVIVEKQEAIRLKNGEHFNLFSVLNAERQENNTHSNFIGELLNPMGCHLKGTAFLEEFVKIINKSSNNAVANFKAEKANLIIEKFISNLVIDDKNPINSRGGRIDILLQDGNLNIAIENKIDAGDQKHQIARYRNYKKPKTIVYYLTLTGKDTDEYSSASLTAGIDYYCISYTNEIQDWLKQCLLITEDQPILHSNIKQYLFLIQKLTNTLNTKNEQELLNVMQGHFKEVKLIADNYAKYINIAKEDFRQEIKVRLEKLYPDFAYSFNSIANNNANIWFEKGNAIFGLESFNNCMFIGLWKTSTTQEMEGADRKSSYWPNTRTLTDSNNEVIDFRKEEFLEILLMDDVKRERLIQKIVADAKDFMDYCMTTLESEITC